MPINLIEPSGWESPASSSIVVLIALDKVNFSILSYQMYSQYRLLGHIVHISLELSVRKLVRIFVLIIPRVEDIPGL